MPNVDPVTLALLIICVIVFILLLALLWLFKGILDSVERIRSDGLRAISGIEARMKEISESILTLNKEIERKIDQLENENRKNRK